MLAQRLTRQATKWQSVKCHGCNSFILAYQGSNRRSFIHKCLINSNILVNSCTLTVRIHIDTLDVTYQFIIKLRNKILFAKHNVCLSLKKLQHMINCHLHRKQIFSNIEALRVISHWVKCWAIQMCTVRRSSFLSTSSIREYSFADTQRIRCFERVQWQQTSISLWRCVAPYSYSTAFTVLNKQYLQVYIAQRTPHKTCKAVTF